MLFTRGNCLAITESLPSPRRIESLMIYKREEEFSDEIVFAKLVWATQIVHVTGQLVYVAVNDLSRVLHHPRSNWPRDLLEKEWRANLHRNVVDERNDLFLVSRVSRERGGFQ